MLEKRSQEELGSLFSSSSTSLDKKDALNLVTKSISKEPDKASKLSNLFNQDSNISKLSTKKLSSTGDKKGTQKRFIFPNKSNSSNFMT